MGRDAPDRLWRGRAFHGPTCSSVRTLRGPAIRPRAGVFVHRPEPVQRSARAEQPSAACFEDPNDNGTLVGLNPGLIYQGDQTLRSLVAAIHDSPSWAPGRNAIVITWDENDYSAAPNPNRVVLTVDTNYGHHGIQTKVFYTHFALLSRSKRPRAPLLEPRLRRQRDRDERPLLRRARTDETV